jgi:DNA processing protein
LNSNSRDLQIAAITLRGLKRVQEQKLREIVRVRGTLNGILDMPFEELISLGFDLAAAEAIINADTSFAEKELNELESMGGRLLLPENSDYPAILKEIYDPPLFLYVLGYAGCLNDLCIAVVGARKVSRSGEDMAFKLANGLAECGVAVASGLAYGADISAHLGALSADGSTIAVLGSGLKNIYPGNHSKYISDICRKGCLITEYSLYVEPKSYNFPKRNRIISGISRGVVIVEASGRSGSLITGRLALEQGRDLFAVPISPLAANNAANSLIKGGAILVQTHHDIIQEYSHIIKPADVCNCKQKPEFDTPEQENVWDEISIEPLTADELVISTGIDYTKLTTILFSMELEGKIKKTGNGRYTPS